MPRPLTSPAAERNKVVIGDVIAKYVPKEDSIVAVEVAAGYGSHMMYNSERFPNVRWYVTEKDQSCMDSISAHLNCASATPRTNVVGPFIFDVSEEHNWPSELEELKEKADIVLSVNLLHITEWENVQGLFAAASKLLKKNGKGKLLTYGPFSTDGQLTPKSNVEFNEHLKLMNPDWGIRDITELTEEASRGGNMVLEEVCDMPANNKTLVWSTYPF